MKSAATLLRALPIGLMALASTAPAQQPVEMRFTLDGNPMLQIGPVFFTDDLYLAPVKDTIQAVLGPGAVPEVKEGALTVSFEGRMLLRVPLEGVLDAEVFGLSGDQVARRVPLAQSPILMPENPGRYMMDLRDIGAILGVTVDIEDEQVSLFTANFWARKLGLPETTVANAVTKSLAMIPEFGISPPAETHVLWVRPQKQAYVQIYALLDTKITPIFNRHLMLEDDWVYFPRAGYTPAMYPADHEDAAYAEAMHFNLRGISFGAYVAIVTSRDVGKDDPIAMIKSGALQDGEWALIGFRQRIQNNPVEFMMDEVRDGESLQDVAKRHQMDLALLRQLNGLTEADSGKIQPGKRVLVIKGIRQSYIDQVLNPDFEIAGMHEVKVGENISNLCRRWGVDVATFRAVNSYAVPGYRLEPGEIVNVPKKKAGAGPPAEDLGAQPVGVTALTQRPAKVRRTSDPNSQVVAEVEEDRTVIVVASVGGGAMYQISYVDDDGKDVEGYVPAETVNVSNVAESPVAAGPVVTEALRWIGTPYQWGGNNLPKGIDCSHFVSQVLTRSGQPAPPAPVVNQEKVGQIVHWKPGSPYRRNGANGVFPKSAPPLTTLKTGDRVIIQYAPLNDRSGSRHTGVYLGDMRKFSRYKTIRYGVIHASSSQGVTVCDLTQNRFMWKNYRYSVRDRAGVASSTSGTLSDMLLQDFARRLAAR